MYTLPWRAGGLRCKHRAGLPGQLGPAGGGRGPAAIDDEPNNLCPRTACTPTTSHGPAGGGGAIRTCYHSIGAPTREGTHTRARCAFSYGLSHSCGEACGLGGLFYKKVKGARGG
eukprot:1181673-Prorocentrum_minimum.AAC.1